jgi:hypothetical protein
VRVRACGSCKRKRRVLDVLERAKKGKLNTTQFVARIIAEKQYKLSLTLALIKETERACKNTKNGMFCATTAA